MDIQALLALVLAAFIFAVSPGPGNMAVLATSTRYGFMPGFFLSVGEVLGDLLYLSIALFSLGVMAELLAPIMTWLKFLGAAYLIYLGYKQFTAKEIKIEQATAARSPSKQILVGFLISGTNPKVVVFYLSFLPLFVDLQNMGLVTGLQVGVVVGLTVLFGLTIIAILGQQLRKLVQRPTIAQAVNKVTGGVMMGVGVAVARA